MWNKYNQTHYDTSNPPPKVVQGFRFNIFYPDLIQGASSSSSVPTYRREADPTNPDNEIVRFSAGAPYADVLSVSQRRSGTCRVSTGLNAF